MSIATVNPATGQTEKTFDPIRPGRSTPPSVGPRTGTGRSGPPPLPTAPAG